MLSFPFTSVDELDRMGMPAGDERRRLNQIINPLSETTPYLRTSLLPGLFGAVARNRSRGNDDLALFETGSVFFAADPPVVRAPPAGDPASVRPEELAALDRALGQQPRHLAVVLTGNWRPDGWPGRGRTGGLAAGDRVRADGRRRGRAGAGPPGRGACALAPGPVCRVRDARRRGGRLRRRAASGGHARRSGCRRGRLRPRSTWTR